MEGTKQKIERGFVIYGSTEGDSSVGIPSMSFSIDLDVHKQCDTEDWTDVLESKCDAPGYEKLGYREYVRDKVASLISELHDNGIVKVYFQDEL